MDNFNKPFTIVNQSSTCNMGHHETCSVESESCDVSHPLSRQATSGKRRLSNRTIDDNYGGSKQRQKLGNAVTYNLELEKNFNFGESFFDTYTARLKTEFVSKELDRNYAVSHSIDPAAKATMSWTVPSIGGGQWNKSCIKKLFSTSSTVGDSCIQEPRCPAVTNNPSSAADDQELDICNHLALGVENMDIQSADTGNSSSSHVFSTRSGLKLDELNAYFPNYIAQSAVPTSEQVFLPPDFRNFISQPSLPAARAIVGNAPSENQIESRHQWQTNARGARVARRLRKSSGKTSVRVEPSHVLSNYSLPLSCQPEHGPDLEVIFSEMGVDQDPSLTSSVPYSASDQLRLTASLNVLETVSSIGTPLGSQSCASTCSHKMDDSFLQSLDIEDRPIAFMSPRERNARIIKWLYSIRRPAVVNEDGLVVDN